MIQGAQPDPTVQPTEVTLANPNDQAEILVLAGSVTRSVSNPMVVDVTLREGGRKIVLRRTKPGTPVTVILTTTGGKTATVTVK